MVALSDKKGIQPLYLSRINTGNHTLERDFIEDTGNVYANFSMPVPTIRFDDLRINADFIKIDAEGHELSILKGMSKSLRNVNIVEYETSINRYKLVVDFMKKRDFRPFYHET